MKIKLVSIGAGGNKAGICAVEKGIINKDQLIILNSTLKDVPEEYKHTAIKFTNGKGCGKDRNLSKNLCMEDIANESLNELDKITDDVEMIVLVSTTEGGTGSGSLPIIANYYKAVLGLPVLCFAFTGFEEDGRGLQNTIEFFQEMEDNFGVQVISNKKFLEVTNNKIEAEKMANEEFVQRLSILIGKDMVDSEQNIDDTDLFKVCSTPGYMIINKTKIDSKIKNMEQLNKAISMDIDNNKSLDISEKSLKRLAVFINISENKRHIVDYTFNIIKDKLGNPFEVFHHVQYNKDNEESISFIASGLNMPLDEVREIYEKLQKETVKINTNKDKFFDYIASTSNSENSKTAKINEVFNTPATSEKKTAQEIMNAKQNFLKGGAIMLKKKKQNIVVTDSINSNNNNDVKKMTREEYIQSKNNIKENY